LGIDWTTATLTSLVVFLGIIVHSIAGFGMAQVVMGLLPLFRDPASASIIFAPIAIISNWRVWWSVRSDFRWKDWAIPVVGLVFGLPAGIYLFSGLDKNQLRIGIGITLLVSVILIALIRQLPFVKEWMKGRGYQPGWKTGVIAGFLTGVSGGAVAIPGPPMILYGAFMMAADYWKGKQMKAVFTALFGTLQLYRLTTLAITGAVTMPLMVEAATAVPALFLGAWIGIQIFDRLPQKVFSWAVLTMLTINAVILLATSILK